MHSDKNMGFAAMVFSRLSMSGCAQKPLVARCVMHRHGDLLVALARAAPFAAIEMRKHWVDLERSRVNTPVQGRSLRDAFARCRKAPPAPTP
jgi:hypothetical protein